jgi:hypothetical protein
MLPSALLTASASQQAEFSELNLHGLLPRCVRFAPTSRPVNGNTRYRPACSLWPGGTYTRWIPLRSFTVSSSVPPLPRFSQRDNSVGPVKSFFERTGPFTPKSGLHCSCLTSAHRQPRLARNHSVSFGPTHTSLRSKLRPRLFMQTPVQGAGCPFKCATFYRTPSPVPSFPACEPNFTNCGYSHPLRHIQYKQTPNLRPMATFAMFLCRRMARFR